MIIAIDGPAASGKSTVARALARQLSLTFLDTGAMYRAVTLRVLEGGGDPRDAQFCTQVARSLVLSFDGSGDILVDGEPGEPAIRAAQVSSNVSHVAAHAGVRAAMVPKQRELAARRGVVAEGRDTTTVVFPEADHKFFLVASARERARRRAEQDGHPERIEQYEVELLRRDALDSSRADSPLRQAADAVLLDTDLLSRAEVLEELLRVVRESS